MIRLMMLAAILQMTVAAQPANPAAAPVSSNDVTAWIKAEGFARERLATCQYSAEQRAYAGLLSARASKIFTIQYAITPEQVSSFIQSGQLAAKKLMSERPDHGLCEPIPQACLLQSLVARDQSFVELLGPLNNSLPADWPDAQVDCPSGQEPVQAVRQAVSESSGR